jgi:hypothetical protein
MFGESQFSWPCVTSEATIVQYYTAYYHTSHVFEPGLFRAEESIHEMGKNSANSQRGLLISLGDGDSSSADMSGRLFQGWISLTSSVIFQFSPYCFCLSLINFLPIIFVYHFCLSVSMFLCLSFIMSLDACIISRLLTLWPNQALI